LATGSVSVRVLRYLPRALAVAVVLFAVLYVLVIAEAPPEAGTQTGTGTWRTTTFGSAIDDPGSFFRIVLDALTFAGLLFIVASGFSLIFGLMRVVNMAHGSFYLLGGYIAYEIQQDMTGEGFAIPSFDVNTWEWIAPLLVGASVIAAAGFVSQQALLRWNQGQELRQALITIAISVVIADQIIEHFEEGIAVSLTWPGWLDRQVNVQLFNIDYSLARLAVLALGIAVGIALWLWLYRTRTGMVIRAGVDDQQMTSALGVNIQKTFAIAFIVGSALAAFGGVVGASQGAVASGQDGVWLLNSLVVVIIGGMGSLVGAAAGSLLYALVFNFSSVYLPTTSNECCTQYSIVFTFILLAFVLAFRPQGLFGKVA
jgi:branched-chain amino acid transport system permease protein